MATRMPRYTPAGLEEGGTAVQPRSSRYYHRERALAGLDQLLALGRLDEAVSYCLPFLERIEGIPVAGSLEDALAAGALADLKQNVALEEYRAGRISLAALEAHAVLEIKAQLTALRAIRDARRSDKQ